MKRAEYRFVVENRFRFKGMFIHALEHYFEVEVDGSEIHSRDSHLSLHWLPLDTLAEYDLRPWVVRDIIASGTFRHVQYLRVPLPEKNA